LPAVTDNLIAVTMPQMGVSVEEGTVLEWSVQAGDRVEVDQTICEISTDKVETEVPAPASGTLVEIMVPAGETVRVGTALARISVSDEQGVTDGGSARQAADAGGSGRGSDDALTARQPDDAPIRVRHGYSPVVRRIANARGIDLEQVSGTGRDGRVTKRDVMDFVEVREPAAGSSPLPALSPMRRIIAERMTHSLRTAAHCHTFIEVDMSRVEFARRALGVGPLPIVARAAIEALRVHPVLNSRFDGDVEGRQDAVNLGIAVSLGEDGLIVPVIRGAQELSVEGLAQRIGALADRARTRRLDPAAVQDGTFTITNLGAFGTLMSTPIINQPQVGILDLQAIVKRPVVVDDAIAIRPMTVLGLGWDHRALDGVQAAQFLATLRDTLQAWPTSVA
jgi:pyruvate/2-oxoglutarate dehydrogenase complex dihydrolipoamide acyltransferase (E2) component